MLSALPFIAPRGPPYSYNVVVFSGKSYELTQFKNEGVALLKAPTAVTVLVKPPPLEALASLLYISKLKV